ncbi:hypothetical protein [Streptococcus sp. sy010]|uniref:hypothetical protein n=1 Tax=Streptococcus sp. sy010 TaxID=2600148 RepID=UPI0011B5399C|nr:hypothetical protein [Streptococcus sp. sy010]TWT14418.1 hypothetical protein FRX51_04525 [Streptococcus sp. sy010]
MEEIKKKILKELRSNYKSEHVIPGLKIKNSKSDEWTVDFAIVDTKINTILAIFQIKELTTEQSQDSLTGYNGVIGNLQKAVGWAIPVYYILVDKNQEKKYSYNQLYKKDKKFKFQEVSLPTNKELKVQYNILNRESLTNFNKQALTDLEKWCRICAVVLLVIFVVYKILSYFLEFSLTVIDLVLIFSATLCVLFPYVEKITYGKFEIKNYEIKEHKNSDSK